MSSGTRNLTFNLHIYQTGVENESRLRRHCEAIQEGAGFNRVEFLGCSTEGDQKLKFGNGLTATLLKKKDTRYRGLLAKILSTRRWGQRALKKAIELSPDVITCHSLPVLPICVKAKKKLGCLLMYEPHELET